MANQTGPFSNLPGASNPIGSVFDALKGGYSKTRKDMKKEKEKAAKASGKSTGQGTGRSTMLDGEEVNPTVLKVAADQWAAKQEHSRGQAAERQTHRLNKDALSHSADIAQRLQGQKQDISSFKHDKMGVNYIASPTETQSVVENAASPTAAPSTPQVPTGDTVGGSSQFEGITGVAF